jgi:hypothetical protein
MHIHLVTVNLLAQQGFGVGGYVFGGEAEFLRTVGPGADAPKRSRPMTRLCRRLDTSTSRWLRRLRWLAWERREAGSSRGIPRIARRRSSSWAGRRRGRRCRLPCEELGAVDGLPDFGAGADDDDFRILRVLDHVAALADAGVGVDGGGVEDGQILAAERP